MLKKSQVLFLGLVLITMLLFDEDTYDSGVNSAPRYPCMPSLISLQQMNNRLHLAYTGKKLMKWTVRATEKELRMISIDIAKVCSTIQRDARNCFIMLARARFYFPELNRIVTQNIGQKAAVGTWRSYRFVAGVKILQQHLIERMPQSYVHLGLGMGGNCILETKDAFRYLLKRLVWIVELKNGFRELDEAYKKASKKQHVLERIVIPRAMSTVSYIKEQMDEHRREEFYRIKKILAVKRKILELKKLAEAPPPSTPETFEKDSVYICLSGGDQDICAEVEEICPAEILDAGVLDLSAEAHDICAEVPEICPEVPEIRPEVQDLGVKEVKPLAEPLVVGAKGKVIPSDLVSITESAQTCTCSDSYESEQQFANMTMKKGSSSIDTEKSVRTTDYDSNLEDLELGIFEIEYTETTKIVRVKNEDGTVKETVQVYKKNIERRTPYVDDSQEFNVVTPTSSYNSKRSKSKYKMKKKPDFHTVGAITLKYSNYYQNMRKVKSEILPSSVSTTQSVNKLCVSAERFCHSNGASCSDCFTSDIVNAVFEKTHEKLQNASIGSMNTVQQHEISENSQYNIITEDSSKYSNIHDIDSKISVIDRLHRHDAKQIHSFRSKSLNYLVMNEIKYDCRESNSLNLEKSFGKSCITDNMLNKH